MSAVITYMLWHELKLRVTPSLANMCSKLTHDMQHATCRVCSDPPGQAPAGCVTLFYDEGLDQATTQQNKVFLADAPFALHVLGGKRARDTTVITAKVNFQSPLFLFGLTPIVPMQDAKCKMMRVRMLGSRARVCWSC